MAKARLLSATGLAFLVGVGVGFFLLQPREEPNCSELLLVDTLADAANATGEARTVSRLRCRPPLSSGALLLRG